MTTDNYFDNLVSNLDRDDLNEILFNWNESELNEAGTEIMIYVDSRANGPRTGGADIVDKKEFIDWILSEAPFDSEIYGEVICEDNDWIALIEKARQFLEKKKP